jgi:hypothetical protein
MPFTNSCGPSVVPSGSRLDFDVPEPELGRGGGDLGLREHADLEPARDQPLDFFMVAEIRRRHASRSRSARGFSAPTGRLIVFRARHVFTVPIPAVTTAREDEDANPPRVQADWDEHRAGGVTRSFSTPAPRSKPVAHASRLVTHNAPSVAFGRGVKSRPQGQLTTTVLSFEAFRARTSK